MTWTLLGTLTFTDWNAQQFAQPVIGASIFRITQDYYLDRQPYGRLSLVSVFPDGSLDVWRNIYPQKDSPKILRMAVPDHYETIGVVTRYIQARPTIRTRWYADSAWTATLEYWEPSPAQPSTEDQLSEVLAGLQRIETKVDTL